jgi:transcriptional regulator with XRE-family HTH domain
VGRPSGKLTLLGKWAAEKGWSREELAQKLGLERRQSVDRLCRGTRRPSLELALLIEKVTGGAVPVSSWSKVPAHSRD